MADRPGFVIPNVDNVGPHYPVSEADKGDLIVLGNARYGIVSGCEVSLSSGAASVASGSGPHIVIVDGKAHNVPETSIAIAGATAGSRFDLIVFDSSGSSVVRLVQGVASSKPVFPDITATMTVLAAIYVPALSDARVVTDKRAMVQPGVWAVAASASDKVFVTYDLSGDERFFIRADGTLSWANGALLYPDGPDTLTIYKTLKVHSLEVSDSATVDGRPIPTRITWGTGDPNGAGLLGDQGDLYVDESTGTVWVLRGLLWVGLGEAPNEIVMTFATDSPGAGWERITVMDNFAVVLANTSPDTNHGSTTGLNLFLSPPMRFWRRSPSS